MSVLSPQAGMKLLRSYKAVRPKRTNMGDDSAAVWSLLNGIQDAPGIEGDFLELGVRFGGSALFALQMLRPGERAYLVDVERTSEFDEQLALVEPARQEQVEFLKMRTDDERLEAVRARRYRWIHIDANHLYSFVKHDLLRFADSTAEEGILVLDDFFQIAWPDVTTVVYEFLASRPDWKVLFIGFNKVYLVRASVKARYRDILSAEASPYLAEFGTFNLWTDLKMAGDSVCAAKRRPNKLVQRRTAVRALAARKVRQSG
jgi:hypothetical protein